jgi:dihydropteroate synthase
MLFKFKKRSLPCCGRSYLVGIVNVTPDSFSDGSKHLCPTSAVKYCIELLDSGADIIDIGGESSRPGSESVAADEEIRRILPVIGELRKLRKDAVISVDTMKSEVADKALSAGADIVNDVSALRNSQDMAAVIARHDAGVILMHMRGNPKTMQSDLNYTDLIGEISSFLTDAISRAVNAGINMENIAVDPGLGFGKSQEQNVRIISEIETFRKIGRPLFVGPSRKAFIGKILGGLPAADRVWGTAGAVAYLAMKKTDFIRVHDVKEMSQMLKVLKEMETVYSFSDK